MSINATKLVRAAKDRYLDLVVQFPLRPLRTKAEYNRAMKIVEKFAVRDESALSAGEADYLETLAMLVEAYESKHDPVDTSKLDPIAVLKHLMEAHEMTTSDLGALIGSKGVASEILRGKRAMSKGNMLKLAERFNVDAGVFFPTTTKRN